MNPSFNHPHVWGSSAEAKLYNPDIKKLESRTVSCKFVVYSKRSKSYRFYCPSRHMKIVKTDVAKFIENNYNDGSMVQREVAFEEKNDNNPGILPNLVSRFLNFSSLDHVTIAEPLISIVDVG